nr:predicted protein [Hordeum vulgare subsp. vulgare]
MLPEIREEGGVGTSATKAMSASLSGKRGRYVRQVTGRHNDTDLHVAARAGDAAALRRALDEAAVVVAAGEAGEGLEAVRRAVAAEANEAGETPLLAAAEKGHLEVVVELLRHLDAHGVAAKNRSGYDALHVAAREGHHAVVQEMLCHDRMAAKTFGPANTTPLISAATRGHAEVVKLLLEQDDFGLGEMAKDNGKNALHFAARQGHMEI